MAFLAKGNKKDLQVLASELGIQDVENLKVLELKNAILKVDGYEEEFVKGMLNNVIEDRNNAIEDRKRKEALEDARRDELRKQEDELRKQEMEENKRKDELRKQEMELEALRLQLEEKKLEHNIKSDVAGETNEKPRMKLHNIIQKFDPKTRDISLYLVLFERQAKRAGIEEKYWVSHLIGLLPYEISEILAREDEQDTDEYEKVKEILLRRYKLTPEKFRQLFTRHIKKPDITWRDFAYELKNYFGEWIRGLEVTTFGELCDLMVTDQIKKKVPPEVKEHFFDEWSLFKSSDIISEKLDDYENIKTSFNSKKYKETSYKENWNRPYRKPNFVNNSQEEKKVFSKPHPIQRDVRPRFSCYSCGKDGHTKKYCPELSRAKADQDVKRKAQVNNTTVEKKKEDGGGTAVVAKVMSYRKSVLGEKLCELERIDVSVDGKPAKALIDSGTEITVVRKDIISNYQLEDKPSIYIKGIFGPAEKCPLVNIPMSLILGGQANVIHQDVLCAIAPSLVEDILMPPDIRNILSCNQDTDTIENITPQEDEDVFARNPAENDSMDEEDASSALNHEVQVVEVSREDDNFSKSELFRKEQEKCEDLQDARKQAVEGTGGFYLHDNFLFHKEKVLGEAVGQLVLPKNRREEVLKLAHCSIFGGHMGAKKTTERIRYSFYWTGLSKDVRKFCQLCGDCQMTRRIQQKDRTPITPVTRPSLPFQVVNVDLIGPIQPPSSKGHRYILCMVDQHTRWAEAVPLTSLNAKATCEALLSIFMRTGIPNVIASDNGTNFHSALTQEFERRIGSSPRFSTPSYPQSNGLVERFNQTLKRMLHHVIREEPRNWHTKIPFILWAYREVPNSTTGVAPFQLLYGRKPEGPLAILKNTWSGKLEALQLDTTPVSSYMEKLKAQLEDAAEKAKMTSEIQQERMAHYYNLRSSKKSFMPGDKVIVLIPDSSNKLLARWQGPGVIESKKNEHSFFVKMPDNSVKHVHQNKIREFVSTNCNTVNVIFEGEEEFGDVESTPLLDENFTFPQEILAIKTPWLNQIQREQLVELLEQFEQLFTRPVQPTTVGEHKIELLPNSTRRKPHAYSIPMSYRAEVDKQVQELFDLNLIEHSDAEITYPIVCVAKKDASIRMCVDYRALNSVTRVPSYPMKDMQELIFTAGMARWLTCLDLLKGYYQIRMREGSKIFTAFSTHNGVYQWKVMPFGLAGASGTFQKSMNSVLRNHSRYAQAYIDDIVVFSKTWEEHLSHLHEVLVDLEKLGFSVRLKKCTFAAKEITFLGHKLGNGKHAPDDEKILAIKQLKRPTTKKEVRSVLGLMGFYRSYIPNYAELAHPLTELTKGKKSGNVCWGKLEEEAFQRLKNALCKVTALSTPDCNQPFQIHVDASAIAVGGCLTQLDEKGNYKPIAFVSRKLNNTQRNWATIEREAYAVLFGLQKFDKWLHGSLVEIITDHNPLKFLTQTTPKSPKLVRWALALQKWNYKVTHRPGIFHQGADALSRLAVHDV